MRKRYFRICVSELALPYKFEEMNDVDFEDGVFYAPDVIDLCSQHSDKVFYFDRCVFLEEKKEAADLFDYVFKDGSNLVLNNCNVISPSTDGDNVGK